MDVYGMEIFLIGLVLLLVAAVFSLVAAGTKKDKQAGIEPTDTGTVTDDLRLMKSCHELKQLAARAREEIKHG